MASILDDDNMPRNSIVLEDERFAGWTEEQYRHFEDSVWAVLYPPVTPMRADSTLFDRPIPVLPAANSSGTIDNTYVPKTVSIDKTKEVGQITIKSGMTQYGAKTYEIPIKVFPGMDGFNPNISLSYNSQAGNSFMGMGWSLSGLSTITRGAKNRHYDKKAQGVLMDNTDAFYLDGIRLVKASSTSGYILYEMQGNENIKVKGYVNGTVMKYFEVFFPDGTRGVFGSSSNTSTNYLYYPLISMTGSFGKTITYSYNYVDNHYKISKISYNGASVEFQYISRKDRLTSCKAGLEVVESQLLSKVICKLGSTILGTYDLTYTLQNAVSLLTQVNYTVSGKSYNPLRFYYGDGVTANSYTTSQTHLYEWYTYTDPSMVKVAKGKFDYACGADGLIVLPNLNPYWKHYRHSTMFRHSENRFDNKYTGNEEIYLYAGLSESYVNPMPNLVTEPGFVDILCADLEGTQEEYVIKINDLVNLGQDQVTFTVYRSSLYGGLTKLYTRKFAFSTVYTDANGSQSIQPKFYYAGDFNGDGKMEVMAVSVHEPFGDTTKPSKCYVFDLVNNTILYQGHVFDFKVDFVGVQQTDPKAASNNTDKLFVMDYDGDGKTDICHIDDTGLHLYSFNASSTSLTLSEAAIYTDLTKVDLANRDVLLGDYNGDALVDLMVSPPTSKGSDTTWNLYCSKGNGQFAMTAIGGNANTDEPGSGFISQDINCDGKTDIVTYSSKGFYTDLTNEDTYASIPQFYTSHPSESPILVPTNISSRNSFVQLLSLKDGIVTKYNFSRNDNMAAMMTGMANSLGVVERNEYDLIDGSNGFFQKGSNAVFPYVNIQEPVAVVSATETYMNGNKVDNKYYMYYNAVAHLQGLGFCGFERITHYNARTQPTEYTYMPLSYGLLKSEKSSMAETTYSFSVNTQASNMMVKIRLMNKNSRDVLKGTTVSNYYYYDEYGNPTQEITSYSDATNMKKLNTYSNNATLGASYRIGFLTDQKIITSRYGQEDYVERIYIPAHTNGKPIMQAKYVNGNQTEYYNYMYDNNGNLTKEYVKYYSSTNSQANTYTYDSYGRISKEVNPKGLAKEYAYDNMGRLSNVKDFRGGITTYGYDAFGRKLSVNYPDNTSETTQFSWSSEGTNGLYAVTKTSATGVTTTTVYDALGREVRKSKKSIDGGNNNTDFIYDSYGNLQKESLPFTGSSTTMWKVYGYDSYDRLLSCVEPSGRETTYSYSGNSVTTTEDNVPTTRTYDTRGNLISVTDPGGTIVYNLAADGKPSSVEIHGDITTTFTYDDYRRCVAMDDPSLGMITYEYDASGNLSKETDANGKVKQYEYDVYNRLTKATMPEFATTYIYNSKDELTGISSSNGTSKTFTYDDFGRLITSKENAMDGKWLQKDYTYNSGNISSIQYTSQLGVLATEKYIFANGHFKELKLNDVTTICDIVRTNAFDKPVTAHVGGFACDYGYNAQGRLNIMRTITSHSMIRMFNYSFNPETNNLISRIDGTRNITESFDYDNLNRLTSFGSKTATYDSKGNITSLSDVGSFTYGLTQKPYALSGASLTGNIATTRLQDITYASFSRPLTISENGYTATFDYNGDYDRVKMTLKQGNNSVLTRYYLGGCYELDVTGSSTKEKLYLTGDYYSAPAVVVKEGSATNIYYILRDYLGSITQVFSPAGDVVQELSYDAWGRLRDPVTQQVYALGKEPALFLGRGYTGHEHLTQFGLINMNARLYDPALGRFLSPDPYIQTPDLSQNFNRYSYTLNNPLKYTDKNGKFFIFTLLNGFIDGVRNIIEHGFNVSEYTWKNTVNSWKIDMGMFKGNFGQVLNKWTWGLVNSVVGNLVAEAYNLVDKVDGVTEMDGMLALAGPMGSSGRAATIGHYSLGPEGYTADWRDHLFVHEYGHYIQSQRWGVFYMPAIAIPSVASAAFTSKWSGMKHKERWFEVNASKLGAEYFDEKYGSGAKGYKKGDENYFDVQSFQNAGISSPYSNPRNGTRNRNSFYPTSGTHLVIWDFIF